jgi:hypothetical protein
MRAGMLLPKRKQCFKSLAGKYLSIQHIGNLDLGPRDFHLFTKLKKFLGGRRFKSDEEVKDDVKEWAKWTGCGGL